MKVAIFLPLFWPESNGIVNFVEGLYNEVIHSKPDLKLVVVTFDTKNTGKILSEEQIFKIYRLPCYKLLGGTYIVPSFKGLKAFFKILRDEKFDIVNTNTRFMVTSLLGLFTAKFKKIPLLHTEHGASFVKDGSVVTRFIARVYDETLGRLVITSATRLYGVSKPCLSFCEQLGGRKGKVIYNGIDLEFWKTEERKPNPITKICFCSRMVKGKGVQDLLMSLSELTDLNWELHLIGDGNYLTELQKLANSLKLNDRIIWHGNQNLIYIKEVLKSVDLFINPSYTEGGPRTVLEAGAMRCAIISTNVGVISELISENINGKIVPVLVNNQNRTELVNAIRELILNPVQQREFGDRISEVIAQKFAWTNSSNLFIKDNFKF